MTCPEGSLCFDFAAASRERLAASGFGSLAADEKVVDLFCGAGGWGDGLASVGIRTDFAINHDATAIEFHQRNHPWCVHHQGDAWRTKPRDVVGSARIGLLLASAACTTHSRAKGAAPVSKRVHMLGSCILRWMKETTPRLVLVENVAEWMDWGPLIEKRHANGKLVKDAAGRVLYTHDPARKGTKWRWWLRQARKLGYALDFRVLDAADFGNASRRKRLFVMLRRDGQPLVWPEVTHGRIGVFGGAQAGVRCDPPRHRGSGPARGEAQRQPDAKQARCVGIPVGGGNAAGCRPEDEECEGSKLRPHRSAAEIIDWSDLGCSIFANKAEQRRYFEETGVRVRRPLKPASLGRIAFGTFKHVLTKLHPFTLRVTQTGPKGGWKVAGIHDPLATVTTREDFAMCTPVVGVMAYGDGKDGTKRWGRPALPVAEPLGTLHAGGNNFGVIAPVVAPINTGVVGSSADRGGPTVTTRGHQAVISPLLATTGYGERDGQEPRTRDVAEPLGTIVNGSKEGIATPLMVYANHGEVTSGRVDAPLRTVVASGGHAGLVAPLMCKYNGSGSGETLARCDVPAPTVTTVEGHGMVAIRLDLNHPRIRARARQTARFLCKHLDAKHRDKLRLNADGFVVTVVDGWEMVVVDIYFRMLRVPELAAAMGFGPERVWPESSRDATRLIGNAVSPVQARALVSAMLPGGRDERKVVAA